MKLTHYQKYKNCVDRWREANKPYLNQYYKDRRERLKQESLDDKQKINDLELLVEQLRERNSTQLEL